MTIHARGATYISLWVLALAFGWIEASVVIYLREAYLRDISLPGGSAAWLAGRGIIERAAAFGSVTG